MAKKQITASEAGAAMRAINSPAQQEAARQNGQNGGRPRTLGAVVLKLEAYQNQRGCKLSEVQHQEINAIKHKLIAIMDEIGE